MYQDNINVMAEVLLDTMKELISKAGFDRTDPGIIYRVYAHSNPAENEYLVRLNGEKNNITVPSAVGPLAPYTRVRVTTPSGHLEQRFISSVIP